MNISHTFLLSASIIVAAPVHAEDAAVIRALKAVEAPREIRKQLAETSDPLLKEVMQHLSSHASDEDIYRQVAPAYAQHLSSAEAHRLSVAPNPQTFSALQKKAAKDVDAALHNWADTYYRQQLNQVIKNLAGMMKVYNTMKLDDPVPDVELEQPNLPLAVRLQSILAHANTQAVRLAQQANAEALNSGLDDIIASERLVSAEGIAKSRAILSLNLASFNRYQAAMADLRSETLEQLKGVAMYAADREAIEVAGEQRHQEYVLYAAHLRKILDLYGNMLDLAATCLGRIHLENDALAFEEDDDMDQFNRLQEKLNLEFAEEAKLDKKS